TMRSDNKIALVVDRLHRQVIQDSTVHIDPSAILHGLEHRRNGTGCLDRRHQLAPRYILDFSLSDFGEGKGGRNFQDVEVVSRYVLHRHLVKTIKKKVSVPCSGKVQSV